MFGLWAVGSLGAEGWPRSVCSFHGGLHGGLLFLLSGVGEVPQLHLPLRFGTLVTVGEAGAGGYSRRDRSDQEDHLEVRLL